MERLILVSNRLPVSAERDEEGKLTFTASVGGLATGLSSFHASHESRWVGWADLDLEGLDAEDVAEVRRALAEEHGCTPVFLDADDAAGFYEGFCNSTVWPLFHHFTQFAEFDSSTWECYERVNQVFCDAVVEVARAGDIIWIQDYQLMLLPGMIRERLPDARIGWFLHIPFPSFEIFRMLPWRREVLEGLLGADLVGFHTYDYAQHFLNSCRRLLGVEEALGRMVVDNRVVLADAFPMGIDYERYRAAARSPAARAEADSICMNTGERKLVLSIDRLDYTKGIPDRLRTFDAFLERYPEWRERVTLMCVAVPSRENVETYRLLKTEVDELIGSINGRYATMDWTPVRYLYRSLPFDTLTGMYAAADVALVTPLRDGMNLIAKEYLAAHDDEAGVLVLSEMAGAARELGEALQVNPFDREQMVQALHQALVMDEDEARARNSLMQPRLRRYTVMKWAEEFLSGLDRVKDMQAGFDARLLDTAHRQRLVDAYRRATQRLILLDYDGTLMPFAPNPEDVTPAPVVRALVSALVADERNEVVIISGRDRETLESWLGDLGVDIVAEHGVWLRGHSGEWRTIGPMSESWKPRVASLLQMYVDRTPGSFIEEKDFSLAWHHRRVTRELAEARVLELKDALASVVNDWGLAMMDGNKVLEIKAANVNKGRAAHRWMCREDVDFVLAIGDDRTDEDVFEAAPDGAWTIKVGSGPTQARNSVRSVDDVRSLLAEMTGLDLEGSDRS